MKLGVGWGGCRWVWVGGVVVEGYNIENEEEYDEQEGQLPELPHGQRQG